LLAGIRLERTTDNAFLKVDQDKGRRLRIENDHDDNPFNDDSEKGPGSTKICSEDIMSQTSVKNRSI
jgi:hypothetical protein